LNTAAKGARKPGNPLRFTSFQALSGSFSLFQPLSGSFSIAHQKPQFGGSVVLKQNSAILADPPVELV
jgi:hypothetical protein